MRKRLDASRRKWLVDRFKHRVRFDAPMGAHTSFKIGGPAEALVVPENRAEVAALVRGAREREIPYYIVGGGTNLLVTDQGISGLVILVGQCLDHIVTVEEMGGVLQMSVGAGVPMKRLCRYCLSHGLRGINFAIGIPGTVGGAITMNAGTGNGSIADVLSAVMVLMASGEIRTVERQQIRVAPRSLSWDAEKEVTSAYPPLILGGEFLLTRSDAAELRIEAANAMRARAQSQPIAQASAGCIYKNPIEGPAAGWLIEQAGLKGKRHGGAVISERHANYIVNKGGAEAADVLALMALIEKTVWNRFQVQLIAEVKIVGD